MTECTTDSTDFLAAWIVHYNGLCSAMDSMGYGSSKVMDFTAQWILQCGCLLSLRVLNVNNGLKCRVQSLGNYELDTKTLENYTYRTFWGGHLQSPDKSLEKQLLRILEKNFKWIIMNFSVWCGDPLSCWQTFWSYSSSVRSGFDVNNEPYMN